MIYSALPCPDGNFWLVSSGPYNPDNGFHVPAGMVARALPGSPSANYNQLDLYSFTGEHLQSVRLLEEYAGWHGPMAATSSELVLQGTDLIHFGTAADGNFKEQTQVKLAPPVRGGIRLLSSSGDLLLIDRALGNMVVIDPRTKAGSVVQLPMPHPVQAATADSGYVYLLFANTVLKTDLAGQILHTYGLQLSRGFVPASLGVTGNSLYLVNKAGHAARYQLN